MESRRLVEALVRSSKHPGVLAQEPWLAPGGGAKNVSGHGISMGFLWYFVVMNGDLTNKNRDIDGNYPLV
jgi:hypothetical protein